MSITREEIREQRAHERHIEQMRSQGYELCTGCEEFYWAGESQNGRCSNPYCQTFCDCCDAPLSQEGFPDGWAKCLKCGTLHYLEAGKWEPVLPIAEEMNR